MAIFKKKKQKTGTIIMPPELPATQQVVKEPEKPVEVPKQVEVPKEEIKEEVVVPKQEEKKFAKIMAAQVTEDGKIIYTILSDDDSLGNVGDMLPLEE